jgi:hypothetical protein
MRSPARSARRCGAWAIWSGTEPNPTHASNSRGGTPPSAWPATMTWACGERSRSRSSPAARQSRHDGRRRRSPHRRSNISTGSSRSTSTRTWASITPARAIRCGSTSSRRSRRSCASISSTTGSLSFSRAAGASATGQTRADGEELNLSSAEWLINPGSVGQPRDGDPRAAWLELDVERSFALYRRTEYDIAGAAAAIRAARLPDSLAERLAYGQ